MNKRTYIWLACGLPVLTATACAAGPRPARAVDFGPIVFNAPDGGKVGHHFSAPAIAYGCGPGGWDADSLRVRGSLPPGIRLATGGAFRLEGTPRQPGLWEFTLAAYNVSCVSPPRHVGDHSNSTAIRVTP